MWQKHVCHSKQQSILGRADSGWIIGNNKSGSKASHVNNTANLGTSKGKSYNR